MAVHYVQPPPKKNSLNAASVSGRRSRVQYSLKALFGLMTFVAVTVWLLDDLNVYWRILAGYVLVGAAQLVTARAASIATAEERSRVNEWVARHARRAVSMATSACALTFGSWLCAVCVLLAVKGDFWPSEEFRWRRWSVLIDLAAWLILLMHVVAVGLNATSWVTSPGAVRSRTLAWLQFLNFANSAMVLGFLFLIYVVQF